MADEDKMPDPDRGAGAGRNRDPSQGPGGGGVADDATRPRVLEEPGADETGTPAWKIDDPPENPWMRGLFMVILALLFGVGELVLLVAAVLQFLWLLFAREKNEHIAEFGAELADWLARIARFQTGATEEKPFPFARWGTQEDDSW